MKDWMIILIISLLFIFLFAIIYAISNSYDEEEKTKEYFPCLYSEGYICFGDMSVCEQGETNCLLRKELGE